MIATGFPPFVLMETGHTDFNKLTFIPEELLSFEGTLISSGETAGILRLFSAVRQKLAILSPTLSGDRNIWAFRVCNRFHSNKHIDASSAITNPPHTPGHLSIAMLAG